MGDWNPGDPQQQTRRRAVRSASPVAALVRITVLSLATSGPAFIAPTLDALIPNSASLTINGATATRAAFGDSWISMNEAGIGGGVVFHSLREVESVRVCTNVSYIVVQKDMLSDG